VYEFTPLPAPRKEKKEVFQQKSLNFTEDQKIPAGDDPAIEPERRRSNPDYTKRNVPG
jgi:hypothetical protein